MKTNTETVNQVRFTFFLCSKTERGKKENEKHRRKILMAEEDYR